MVSGFCQWVLISVGFKTHWLFLKIKMIYFFNHFYLLILFIFSFYYFFIIFLFWRKFEGGTIQIFELKYSSKFKGGTIQILREIGSHGDAVIGARAKRACMNHKTIYGVVIWQKEENLKFENNWSGYPYLTIYICQKPLTWVA